MRLLGVRPGRESRVALVVTGWQTGKWRDENPVRGDGKLGPYQSYPDFLDDTIYVRRDVLLIADLIRLLQKSGLDAPIIVSDKELVHQVRRQEHVRGIQVNTGDGRWESVTNVVVVGLWGNQVTASLSASSAVPFRLGLDEAGRQVLRVDPADRLDPAGTQTLGPQDDERRDGGRHVKETPGFGFIARLTFADVRLALLGGSYGLPTARMGDLLLNRPAASERLWDIEADADFWVGVTTPARGDRNGLFGVGVPQVAHSRVIDSRLTDVLLAGGSSEAPDMPLSAGSTAAAGPEVAGR